MPDQEGGRVLITSADLGDVGELEIPSARNDGRIGDFLQILVGAVQAHEDLRAFGVDRSCGRYGVLALQSRENIARAQAERGEARVGKFHEYSFRSLTEDVDLFDARHM